MRHRKKIALAALVAVSVMMLAACGSGTGSEADGESKSITFMLPTPSWDVSLAAFAVAQAKGYFAEENLNVKYVLTKSSQLAATTVAQDTDSVGLVSPEPVMIAAQTGKGLGLEYFYNFFRRPIYNLAVLADSEIKDLHGLQGRKVGVQSLSAVGVYYVKAYLAEAGLAPDTVTLIPTGSGTQALTALEGKQVDAMLVNDVWPAQWRNAGVETRSISTTSQLSVVQHGLLTRAENLRNNPDTYAALGRAVAKATLFTLENPEAAITMMWKAQPETKPTGIDDTEAMRQSLMILNARIPNLELGAGETMWGQYPDRAFADSVKFATDSGLITKDIDPNVLSTNDLVVKINDFDAAAVTADADSS
ncbi:NMT1/THI5 like domain protein [Parafrankia sp. EAN1pec]|uniref:ABC transporter substrate-binding protein n=1 Tax=Parafrankia sp. (strain EAN1pec) TaxID=298653 RepID=UPI0000541729|nr:NMT1/THI5 like domain protein [Frankia sp. EAN1pec]